MKEDISGSKLYEYLEYLAILRSHFFLDTIKVSYSQRPDHGLGAHGLFYLSKLINKGFRVSDEILTTSTLNSLDSSRVVGPH